MSKFFVPQTAIVRKVPSSFADSLKQHAPAEPIDVRLAQSQHDRYVEVLREILPKVVELAADENHPDCCFIEDTAVVVRGVAAVSYLGAKERRGEEAPVKRALEECGMKTRSITSPSTLDGGDVLFTGRHLMVGVSKRTNHAAARQLREFFPEAPVITASVEGSLHFKSVMSALDQETLLFGEAEPARKILAELEREHQISKSYRIEWLPDAVAANVLSIDSTLIIQDGFPHSEKVLRRLAAQRGMRVVKLGMSELIKADGALTCCSLLF